MPFLCEADQPKVSDDWLNIVQFIHSFVKFIYCLPRNILRGSKSNHSEKEQFWAAFRAKAWGVFGKFESV